MVQPVVTVAMYYVVFQVIMPQKAQLLGDGIEVPYLVFLTAGLVPWFYFSEALTNGMMALLEYEYLVKKVVFKISILPIIKIIAATFIHGFFVLVLLILSLIHIFKIKFVNRKTGKLIPHVDFQVEIKGPDKTYNKDDDNTDGIIYLTGITPGKYTVRITGPENQDGYAMPSDAQERCV